MLAEKADGIGPIGFSRSFAGAHGRRMRCERVLIVDESGFVETGAYSVGPRQYSGMAGQVEDSQVGVLLGYTVDTATLLLIAGSTYPSLWAEDGEPRRRASMPDNVAFAAKPAFNTAVAQ